MELLLAFIDFQNNGMREENSLLLYARAQAVTDLCFPKASFRNEKRFVIMDIENAIDIAQCKQMRVVPYLRIPKSVKYKCYLI